ncbi:hypothetical protein F4823DRAFT_559044 [Ustulina deusta]|nr:hypothetical protein F4823DRAFT_559044 [Ustulina deusta]
MSWDISQDWEETAELEMRVQSIDYRDPANRTLEFLSGFDWSRVSRFVRYLIAREITSATMEDPKSQSTIDSSIVHGSLMYDQTLEFAGKPVERPEMRAGYAPNAKTTDTPADRMTPTDIPKTDKYQDARGKGSYTYGFKLHPFIATTWHSKPDHPWAADRQPFPPGDPHPANPVPLPDTHRMSWQEVARNVVTLLNETNRVVAMVKDDGENEPQWQMEHLFLESLHRGLAYDVAEQERLTYLLENWDDDYDEELDESWMSPRSRFYQQKRAERPHSPVNNPPRFRFFNPEVADKAVKGLSNMVITILTRPEYIENMFMVGIPSELLEHLPQLTEAQKLRRPRLHEISFDLIKKSASGIPGYLAKRWKMGGFTPREMAEIQKRVEHTVQAQAIRERADPLACRLPLMKPRYLTWSVSRNHSSHNNFKNVKAGDYAGSYDPTATRPVDMYRWAALEVSSPVFRVRGDFDRAVFDSLTAVCETLQSRLRTHHCAVPTLDGTTSIFVGHTEGFTLLELKKLVTLWSLLEPRLRHLHRHRRNTLEGQWACAPLRHFSRLGAITDVPLGFPLADPDGVLPHPSHGTREFFADQMNDHFAAKPLFEQIADSDELYLRAVWQYTSVTDLARATESIGPPYSTSLAIRCRGRGQRTSRLRTTQERIFEANHPEALFPGEEVDAHRGVLEFRQMGQNLDPFAVNAWFEICVAVVAACRETTPVTFRELVTMLTTPHGQYSAWELLGIPPAVRAIFGPADRDRKGYYYPRFNGAADYSYPFYR